MRIVKVVVIFGTRPELIKLAPVILELRRRPRSFEVLLLATGQHRGLLDQMLTVFGLRPDEDLRLMRPGQSLDWLTGAVAGRIGTRLRELRPDLAVVQGDTTTAMASALAAFYQRVPVAHVEAGLRTGDPYDPFPEEINRRIVGTLAAWHFAPTRRAAANLREEGVPAARIAVTGNTVVDALHLMNAKLGKGPLPVKLGAGSRLLLVTVHRRESFGRPLKNICAALAELVRRHPDLEIVYPVHPNPMVRGPVKAMLGGQKRVHLLRPLDYADFLPLLKRAELVLTDSGGIQEEAPAFRKPVLVLRNRTERPEGIEAGVARLAGTDSDGIVREAERVLSDRRLYARMTRGRNPYGDGRAAGRIADFLASRGKA